MTIGDLKSRRSRKFGDCHTAWLAYVSWDYDTFSIGYNHQALFPFDFIGNTLLKTVEPCKIGCERRFAYWTCQFLGFKLHLVKRFDLNHRANTIFMGTRRVLVHEFVTLCQSQTTCRENCDTFSALIECRFSYGKRRGQPLQTGSVSDKVHQNQSRHIICSFCPKGR